MLSDSLFFRFICSIICPNIRPGKLVFNRRTYGTSLGACAARNAGISVDYILSISLRNSRYGTILSASAARNASIGNFVSHSKLTSVLNYLYCITLFRFCI